ncbi:nuclear transport factor 2 family protein [Shimia sp. R9_2]|uniref:nuclear transport factor 2 family protein n=1 Tax=Shimia sp. R9_2 TaxID=2821112 RepID=UPI001AD9FB92|nr:nuclear transport factor 2 family protein [Shimia sp. R9_2]MBO9397401.1 nuclear transport factor 2 family protein [Shimia sp. R9_2]
MRAVDIQKDALLALETRVWTALVQGDAAADGALLTADFLGVYSDGFGDKADHTGQLAHGATVVDFRLSDVKLRQICEDAALLIYRADYLRVGGADWEAMLISSLWERRDGEWRNSFSQDTPLTGYTHP